MQLPRFLAHLAHRFHRVDEKVEYHLLQLDPVSLNEWQALRELSPQRDAIPLNFAPGQGDDLLNDLVEVQQILLRHRPLGERTDAGDDLACPPGIPDDADESLASLRHIWLRPGEPAQTRLRADEYGRDRLVDLMSDGGGDLAHDRDAIDMGELHLRVAQFVLRPLALSDVLDRAEDSAGPTRRVLHEIALTMDDTLLAVGAKHAVLHVVPRAAAEGLRHCPDHDRPILGMDQLRQCGKAHLALLRRKPKDAVGFV